MIAYFHTLGPYRCLSRSNQEHWERRSVSTALRPELTDKSVVAFCQEGDHLIMTEANQHLQPFAKGASSFLSDYFCTNIDFFR